MYVVNEPLALNDTACFARFKALCESTGPALVVVDPLIRALGGVDENQAPEVNAALAPVADLARELGFGLLCIHHSRKDRAAAGLDSLAGSRDFAARADVVLLMQAAGDTGDAGDVLRVSCVKSQWGEAPAPFCIRVEDDPEGNPALVSADLPNARNDILDLLALRSPLTVKEIVDELAGVKTRDQINRALYALLAEGRIIKLRHGLYGLPDGPEYG